MALSWTASTDDVGVTGYGLYLSGSRTSETTGTSAEFTGLKCGTTYTLGVDAKDAGGLRSAVATLSTATSPCSPPPPSSTGAVKQTIANGSTISSLNNWRAVYDANGDGVEDDPGSIQFLIDGNQVLSEINAPFGDTFANGIVHRQQRPAHLPGARTQRRRHPARQQHHHRHRQHQTPPPPPSSTGAVKQTIANGSTVSSLTNWRAVYDANGDGVEDDPGSIQFLIDGNQVLSEINARSATPSPTARSPPATASHTFQVRALNDTGTLLASNTITATSAPAHHHRRPTRPPPRTRQPARHLGHRNERRDRLERRHRQRRRHRLRRLPRHHQGRLQHHHDQLHDQRAHLRHRLLGRGQSARRRRQLSPRQPCRSPPPPAPTPSRRPRRQCHRLDPHHHQHQPHLGARHRQRRRRRLRHLQRRQLVDTTAGNTGIVSGLTCGTNYTLAVDAFDATGNSSPKTTIMVSTLPCADTTPPTVTLTAPTNGSTMTGTVNTSANATDNVGVTRVDFFRDGVSAGSDSTAPYTVQVSTTTIADGSHTFSARAYDSAGNIGNTSSVAVNVSNTAPSSSTGYPNASNTGVPPGTALSPLSNGDVKTNYAVIDRVQTGGCIVVYAYGVTIKNSKVGCIVVDGGVAGDPANPPLTVQDTEIVCPLGSWNTGFRFDNTILVRVNIHGCENGLDVGTNVTIRDSYIHDLAAGATFHNDGMQGANPTNLTVEHNTIYGIDTSAIGFNSSASGSVVIKNNLLAGGAYTLYCPKGAIPNFQVIGNHFSTIFYSKVGAYGSNTDCGGETFSGNVIHETGAPVSLG